MRNARYSLWGNLPRIPTRVSEWNEENQYRRRNNIRGIREEKAAPSKNIDTLTKEESLVAYCRAVCRAEQQWRTGICGGWYWRVSNSIRLQENIYVLDGTLSHISHKTFFPHYKGERNKFYTHVHMDFPWVKWNRISDRINQHFDSYLCWKTAKLILYVFHMYSFF